MLNTATIHVKMYQYNSSLLSRACKDILWNILHAAGVTDEDMYYMQWYVHTLVVIRFNS